MSISYKDAGVDISAAAKATELMSAAVRSTYGPAVLAGLGAFGGCYDIGGGNVLVASTDGVGTKTLIAEQVGIYDTVGQDLVNHCINDILAQGARPLFFLDYVAAAKLDPIQIASIVSGVAKACREAGCALIGGETAEMPGVYKEGAFDLAGTIVGLVQREKVLPRNIAAGDVLLGLPSTGLHTNGYSLARRVFESVGYDAKLPELGDQTVGEALLAVHRCYLPEINALEERITVKGLAHITGGGITDNLPRILPEGIGASVDLESWDVPPLFDLLVRLGNLTQAEAFHALNMGLGMLVVVSAEEAQTALEIVPEAKIVGEIVAGEGVLYH
jgi:phosphoribosylformylglycinamidine cyclo-ligase